MKKLIAIVLLLCSGVSYSQIYGEFTEPAKPHTYQLPSTCQNNTEIKSITDFVKGEMRANGPIAAQVALGHNSRLVMNCGIGYNDPLARAKLVANNFDVAIKAEYNVTARVGSFTKFLIVAAIKASGVDTSQNLASATGLTPHNGVLMSGFGTCTIQQAIEQRCQIIRDFATVEQVEKNTGWKRPLTMEQQLRYELGRTPSFTPGTENYVSGDYSNVGYGLLGVALERATGKNLIDYVHEAVTRPIGIADDEVKVVLGGYQMCSDGKWITVKGVQRCQNMGNATLGREPGEMFPESTFEMSSEYDGASVNAAFGGVIENSGGAFSFVATPRAVTKLLFNYDGTGLRRNPSDPSGISGSGGNLTGASVYALRNGAYSVYLSFNRDSNTVSGNRINVDVGTKLVSLVNGIDLSGYPDLDTGSSSRIQMRTYCNTALNYCFLAGPLSAAVLDNAPGWVRQSGEGDGFTAWAPGVKKNVYRFFHEGEVTHFFGTYDDAKLVTRFNPQLPLTQVDGFIGFRYEAIEMSVVQPNISAGTCESGTVPVYRLFRAKSGTLSANHRYTTSLAFYKEEVARGLAGEGVVFCAAG